MILTESGFDDNFVEGRELGLRDAEAGLPNRFQGVASNFARGYNQGFVAYCREYEHDRKKAEEGFKNRCPGYGKTAYFD